MMFNPLNEVNTTVNQAASLQYCILYIVHFGDCVHMRICASHLHHLDARTTSLQTDHSCLHKLCCPADFCKTVSKLDNQ